ncbi:MAG: hypothetical protein O7D91_13295, partial [Planctomycetota bacterium]|nr:hypothetical protein [Planctomycetota bacterium]
MPVIVRLQAMQQRAGRLLLIHGVALAVLGGAGSLLALFVLDWALWFPSLLRFGFGVAWLVLLAWIISRHIWPPLRSRLSTLHIATKIEEHFPEFEDRLTSAVSFISADYTLQDPLQEKLIERTERIAHSVPIENALTALPVWRTTGLAALPLVAMIAIAVVGPDWISTGAYRVLLPFAPIQWPRTVQIQPLTEDLLIVSGESVVISMEVTKGQSDSLRAYLFMSTAGGLEKTVMRREGPAQRTQPAQRVQRAAPATEEDSGFRLQATGTSPEAGSREPGAFRPAVADRYAWTINTVTQDIRYWFEAGDDSTEDRSGRIRVVSRPRVTALRLTVHTPPYVLSPATEEASGFRLQAPGASLEARSPEPRALSPAAADAVDLIAGSTLEISFKSSKALARSAGLPNAWISTDAGDRIRVRRGGSGRLVVQLMPARDQRYEIHLLDEDGFENEPTEIVTVVVHPDAAPTVAILKPVRVLEVTPQAAVRIIGVARDDLGISRIELSGQVQPASGPGRPFAREILDWTRDESGTPPRRAAAEGIAVRVDFDWALGELNLNVGDRVEYALSAEDNRITETLTPQRGRSYAMRLVVVSEADFAAGVGDELKRLADRLSLVLRRQEQLLADTERHAEMIQESPDFDPDAQLLRLSARQRRLAERVASVRKSARSLADELIRNRISERSEKQQADVFVDDLQNLVEPDMHQAAAILNDARAEAASLRGSAGSAQSAAVDQARAHQQAASVAIRALLDQLTQWNDYRSMLANLRDLVDLQQQVSRQTAAAGDKTLGRDPDDLSDEEQAELQRIAQSQDGITEAIGRALAELHKLQAKLRSSEPDDARALADAERKLAGTGARSETAKRSQSAADAIRDNKTAQAQSEQNSVERALADAVSQLEAREQRKLAELSKKLGNLEDLVLRILEQQEQIRAATQEISTEDAERELPKLAGRQRNLARGTREAVDTLASVPETGEAVQQVRRAAEAMSRATDGLYEIDRDQAVQAQDEAIGDLQLAIEVLAGLREKNEQAIAKAKLIAIKRELLGVRAGQIEINTESERVIQRVHQAGRLTRIDVRRARKQAQAQEALIDKLSEVQDKLDDTPVYAWVVAKVLVVMQASRQMLADTQLEKPLTRAQERAVSLLDQLIDAIKQAESMIEEQFAEGGGGAAGGGPSQMGKQKP